MREPSVAAEERYSFKGRSLVRTGERRDALPVFRFMTANQAVFPIKTMCRVFGVSQAGFYAWQRRVPSQHARADADLTARIRTVHRASRETCGAPRIDAELKEAGVRVGRKRVERLMKEEGLTGVSRRRGTRTTFRDERVQPASDLVDRNFRDDAPDRLWVADITAVHRNGGTPLRVMRMQPRQVDRAGH